MNGKSDTSGSDVGVGKEPDERSDQRPDQRPEGEYFWLLGSRCDAEQLADEVADRSRGDVRSALAWGAG